jgi:hypothetical protein
MTLNYLDLDVIKPWRLFLPPKTFSPSASNASLKHITTEQNKYLKNPAKQQQKPNQASL